MPAPAVPLRITYRSLDDVRADLAHMAHGGVMVKDPQAGELALDAAVALELALPDGTVVAANVRVLHVFPGVGAAVTVTPEIVEALRRHADAGAPPRRLGSEPAAPATRTRSSLALQDISALSHAEKIQLALHGNRDQRNAILRDTNRTLHGFVLRNPQLDAEDVLAIAKNAQMSPQVLEQIAGRKEWLARPQIALALARNPKTPAEVAIRALDHISVDALRQLAKGTGALPHVVQAARKKVLR